MKMPRLNKVLLVEDSAHFGEMILEHLPLVFDGVEILWCHTIEEAEKEVARGGLVACDLVIMDACVHGHELDTDELVRKIRKFFTGLMVALSSDREYNKQLIRAGCDFACRKMETVELMYEVLPEYFETTG